MKEPRETTLARQWTQRQLEYYGLHRCINTRTVRNGGIVVTLSAGRLKEPIDPNVLEEMNRNAPTGWRIKEKSK